MDAWLAQHFFNPAFVAAGAALVSSPIVIHLINRLRYRRVRFAAMEFLLASEQRNKRRVLLEQLLLLLLRIMIVLAIVALIARLILDPNEMSIFRGAKAHHVVLLDDSASMQNRWGETTAFKEAIEVVKKLVAEGAHRPGTQVFTLLLLSNPEQPFLPERDVNEDFVRELETKLENLRPTHRALDVPAGLESARKFLAEERGAIQHLHVISDFRKRDWQDQKGISGAVEAMTKNGVTVNLVKTVPEQHANLAITQFTGATQVAAAGVPLRLRVGVKNFGNEVARNVRVAVYDDGNRIPGNLVFDSIEAGAETYSEFDVRLATPSKHRLHVGLAADALSADNVRHLAVDVSGKIPVLIVDGDPSGEAAAYVADALAADPENTGLSPVVETLDALRRRPLEEFSCIFLLNVPELPPDALQLLEQYVARGGGLAWYVGNAVRPAFYNERLYREGKGLFPVRLGTAPRELPADDTNPGPDLKVGDHPLFAIFAGQDNPFIDAVSVRQYFPVADDWARDDQERKDGVRTIAALRNNSPFMFEHRFGRGSVVTVLSTAGPEWNDWAVNPSYVVVQLDLQKHIARADRALETRIVGESIELRLDPAVHTETVEIAAPEAGGERVLRLQAAPVRITRQGETGEGELRLLATFRDTDAPGVYTVRTVDQNQIPDERLIAYNVSVDESELALAGSQEIRRRLGDAKNVRIQEPGNFEWIQGEDAGQEIRTALLVLLVCFLLAEQLMAWRLSYHPKVAGAMP